LIPGLLPRATAAAALAAAHRLTEQVVGEALAAGRAPPPDAAPAEYLPIIHLRRRDATLREVVTAPHLARLAATLLGVDGVRLYHDELFVKPAGAPPTSWHQDQVYWPIDASEVVAPGAPAMVRLWVTLDDLADDGGALRFLSGSHDHGAMGRLQATHPDRAPTAELDGRELPVRGYGALAAGDATAHAGFTVHSAGDNRTDTPRCALAVAYMPDGARVAEPTSDDQAAALALFLDGRRPGDLADGATNPLLWPASA
jgi:ectoine hydroxylase-related dioxygenase (phytanoyl-CoA dioxygenase family)